MNQNDFARKFAPLFEETVCDLEQIDHGADTQEWQDAPASPTFMAFDQNEGSPSVRDSRFLMVVGKQALQVKTELKIFRGFTMSKMVAVVDRA